MQNKSNIKSLAYALSVTLACGLSAVLLPSEKAYAQIEEIVVMARKREESLQDVPISVTAFTSDSLERLQVDNVSQISDATPGLTFDSTTAISGSRVASSIFIRGIGQTDFTLVSDPGVGLYVDGIYVARSVGGVLDIVDVQSLEVLRGPQGTLFGKNTIGGAINVVSKVPADEFGGDISVTVGTDSRADLKASLDIPFSNTFKSKWSLAKLTQDGNVTNLNGGANLNDTDATIARVAFQFDPVDELSMSLVFDWTDRDEHAQAQRLLGFNPAAAGPPLVAAAVRQAPGFDISQFACNGADLAAAAAECPDPFVTNSSSNTPSLAEISGTSFTLEYDFGFAILKSIAGYRDMEALFARDSDNSPIIVVETIDTMEQEQFSQELQLAGSTDRLDWLAGYYHFEEEGFNRNDVITSAFLVVSGGAIKNDSDAIFGQFSYDLNDSWSVTAGARSTEETKDFTPDQFFVDGNFAQQFLDDTLQWADVQRGDLGPFTPGLVLAGGSELVNPGTRTQDFSETTGLLSLDWSVNEDTLVYLKYATGFKSGGFNQRIAPPGMDDPISYEPETSKSVELGLKWANSANTLQLNSSIYHTDYEDLQISVFAGIAPTTLNATSAEVDGFEVELVTAPSDSLIITANMAYIDAGYTGVGPQSPVSSASEFPKTPETTVFLGLDYYVSLNSAELAFHLDWSHRGDVYNNTINSSQIRQDAYDLLNASVTYHATENLQISLAGRNLTDELYLIAGNEELNGFGYAEGIFARQREWSLFAKYSF